MLVSLANAANHHTGRCDPSIERLSQETNLNERSVRRALVDLCESGVISRERPRRPDGSLGRYRYVFPLVTVVSLPPDTLSTQPPDTVSGKQEVNLEPEENLANGVPPPRERNPIWDGLTAIFGEATTESRKTLRGRICRSLTAAGATEDEIRQRARAWPRHFDNATLTEPALEKHWDALGQIPLRLEERRNGR